MHPLLTGRFSSNRRVGNQRCTTPLRGRRIIRQRRTMNLLDGISRPPLLATEISVCDRNPTTGSHPWIAQLQRRGRHLFRLKNLPAPRSRLVYPMSCLQAGIGQRHRAVMYSSTLPRVKHNGSDRLKLRFRLPYLCPIPMGLGWGLLQSPPLRQNQPPPTQVLDRKVCGWGLIQSQPSPQRQPLLSPVLRRRVHGWALLRKQPLS
jgi:hypothetical protein